MGIPRAARRTCAFIGAYADEQTVYVILPFCPNGDLLGLWRGMGVEEAMAATYMGQIVKGLEHLHDMGLAHHDMSWRIYGR